MSAIVSLVPTICFRVPAGDTVSSRGVGSGERAVLFRLVMIIRLRLLRAGALQM